MQTDPSSHDTGPREARISVTRDLLRDACASDPLFRERYDLSTWQELGQGAFAGVARIFCRDRGEDVAVKVFYRLTDESRARMRAEVLNAQRAFSERLVRTHTPFSSGEIAWIEMEYIPGRNLDQEIAQRKTEGRPFTLEEDLELGIAIGEALRAAHQAGVVHRDLKPANLLLPESGHPPVKLGDFGISKFREAAKLTATGEIPGTPQYAAPEVWEARPAGPEADVYSLGLVLFRIFTTGEYAYDVPPGATTAQVFVAHRTQKPRRLREMNSSIPAELDDLIQRMLAKDPKARPSLQDVLSAVGAMQARPAPTPVRSRVRRPGAGVALAFAGMLGVVALLAGIPLRSARDEQPLAAVAPPVNVEVAARPAQSAPTPPLEARVPAAQPRPTPGPPATPPASRKAAFQVAIEAPAVAVTNVSGRPVSGLRVTLVTVSGSRHSVQLADELAAGDVALVPLDEFEPVSAGNAEFVKAEVVAQGTDVRTVTVALGIGGSR